MKCSCSGAKCILCKKNVQWHHTHLNTWSAELIEFVRSHIDDDVGDSQCVCKSHYVEIKRHLGDGNYIPKWKRNYDNIEGNVTRACSYPNCKAQNLKKPLFENESLIKQYINASNKQLLLCNAHYQAVYKHFKSNCTPCAGCGAKPKRGTTYTRHCPNPPVINEHMLIHLGVNLNFTTTDTICYTCYKLHNQILCNIEKKNISYDSALNELICSWHEQTGDAVVNALVKTASHVAQHLLAQKALLLPQVSCVFLEEYGAIDDDISCIQIEIGENVVKYSSRWLLVQLILYLGIHMQYKCVHKKFGIVLYRTNGDLLKSISWALGSPPLYNIRQQCPHAYNTGAYNQHVLHQASMIVNKMLHDEIRKVSETRHSIECNPNGLNVEEYIGGVDPILWEFIVNCTESCRGKKHPGSVESDQLAHLKKLRRFRFFILSLLQYCCNIEQPQPVHNILADVVEMCGGSTVLLTLLNQLGVTSSYKTYDRFVTMQSNQLRNQPVWNELSPHLFTIVSVDNFDMLQSHAAVYCGD